MSLQLPPLLPARPVRRALLETLSEIDHSGAAIDRPPAFAYVPPSHTRALDPDNSVVEGIRGAGKSFWWETLHSEPHRNFIAQAFPDARIGKNVLIAQGFGAQISSDEAPSKDVLAQLVNQFDSRAIWRAVIAKQAGFGEPFPQQTDWPTRVNWTKENPEAYDTLLQRTDATLVASGQTRLILFDALDQLADDWPSIRPLARALLQLALDLRASKRIRLKLFVRPDMLEDREITSFQDASKLLARKATLTWRRADLYALLFQYLGNAPQGGSEFRQHGVTAFGLHWRQEEDGWLLPAPLRTEEALQESVFIAIAGAAMASGPSGHKRGKPYTWLVNHLQDGRDQVSPRSFIAALHQAAADTEEMAADAPLALSYRAIQQGVQAASQIRVTEITEDYRWVDTLMRPLRGQLTVPCRTEDIDALWSGSGTLANLRTEMKSTAGAVKLPPQRLDEGAEGVLTDLESLGLIQRLSDRRIQMPDVYRIAFGLGRRGGVKPLR